MAFALCDTSNTGGWYKALSPGEVATGCFILSSLSDLSEWFECGNVFLKTFSCRILSFRTMVCLSGTLVNSFFFFSSAPLVITVNIPVKSLAYKWTSINYKTGFKVTDSRSPVMMTGQIFFSLDKPHFGQSNNEYYAFLFLPIEYRIMLAVDHCTALTFRFLAASWWKIYSHIVELLSAIFALFYVCLCILWVSSYGGVWSL